LRHATGAGDLCADLGRRQHAAVAGLCALRELDFYQFYLWITRLPREMLGVKISVGIAAAKITGANFPDKVAACLTMIGRDGTLAGIVGKAAHPGTAIERANGIGRERAKAHGRHIEQGNGIRLGALTAHRHAKIRRSNTGGRQ